MVTGGDALGKSGPREAERLDDAQAEALQRTFAQLAVPQEFRQARSWRVLAAAPKDMDEITRVYKFVNDDLAELAHRGTFDVRHITGEARVLVDPAHRNILHRLWTGGNHARLACQNMDEQQPGPLDFFRVQRRNWVDLEWFDFLDILGLASDGALTISALTEEAPAHFSVYGDRRILLQEPHTHPTYLKHVFYLESDGLAAHLRNYADEFFSRSRSISPVAFRSVYGWLYSRRVKRLLEEISTTGTPTGVENDDLASAVDLGLVDDSDPSRLSLSVLGISMASVL